MKLIIDVLRVVLTGLVLLFVTMTVLAGGSMGRDLIRKVDQTARCSLAECAETVEAFEAAAEQAQRALDEAERLQAEAIAQLADRKRQAHAQIAALRQQEQGLRDKLSERVQQSRETFQELNLADSFEGWAPEDDPHKRNTLFIETCERLSVRWNAKRCEEVLDDAKVTPRTNTGLAQLSHADWHRRVKTALDASCEKGTRPLQDLVEYCSVPRIAVSVGLDTIHTFLQSVDRYNDLSRQADAVLNEAEKEETALASLVGDESVERALVAAQQQHAHTRERLAGAQELLREARRDPWRLVVEWRDRYWEFVAPFALAATLLLLANFFWRPLAYFVLAPLIRHTGHLRLLPENENKDAVQADELEARSYSKIGGPAVPSSAEVIARAGSRQINVRLKPEEHLWVRPQYVTSSRGGGSIWIYGGWRHPFTSYAAGLVGLTHFIGADRSKITLGGTGDEHTNEYIGSISLSEHPGFALRPRHIVAIQGDLTIHFFWSFKLMSILRGQLRHAVVSGTGTVYVAGNGGVFPQVVGDPELGREHTQPSDQLKDALIVGWDAQLEVSLRRNENWIHVALLRRDDMFETALLGEGVYIQTHSTRTGRTDVVGRLFESILSAVGKVLGI